MQIVSFIQSNRKYFEDFITRSTYHSNAIEGNTLSYAETYAILFNDNSFKVNAKPREIYEAINHKYALSHVLGHTVEDLSERFIKDIAIYINKNIMEIDGYRTTQVFIQGAEHIPPAANMIPQAMMYFVHNYTHTQYTTIFEKIAVNHVEFERIHPFPDGNGRTGRLLINYELLKNDLPPVVIPTERRAEYFKMLSSGDTVTLSAFIQKLSSAEADRIQLFLDEAAEKR